MGETTGKEASAPAKTTLAKINEEIHELVHELNELIDEDFAIQDTQRTLDCYTELIERYSAKYHAFVNQLIELRCAYVALNNKFRGNKARALSMAKKLYATLLKKYEAEAQASNELMRPIEQWEIAQQFPVPKASVPKQSGERSKAMVKFSHRLFNARHHFHARTHWTLAGAEAHRNELIERLMTERANHDERENELRRLELSIGTAKDQIEWYRRQLVDQPPHNIWLDAYDAHANFVREILRYIHSTNHERAIAQVALQLARKPVAKDRGARGPAASSYRRMSGPDINDIAPAEIEPVHSTPLRVSLSFQLPQQNQNSDGATLDHMFDLPHRVRYSKSVAELKQSRKSHPSPMDSDWVTGKPVDTTQSLVGTIPFPLIEPHPVAPMLAARLRDVNREADQEYGSPDMAQNSAQETPDTPADDALPKHVSPLRISRARAPFQGSAEV